MKKHLKKLVLKHGNELIDSVMTNNKMRSLTGGSCGCDANPTNLACSSAFGRPNCSGVYYA